MDRSNKSGIFWARSLLIVFLGIGFIMPLWAANKPIGRVMMAQGRIELIHADGTRNIARGGTYFLSGDTFKTSDSSRAQLRFEDGTLISLRPKSEFQVNEYRYDPKNKQNNRSVFSLIKGGFSTVSGWLGKLQPEAYEVRTPVAIVGIRGTHYELVMEDGLSAAVWQGGISLKNQAGDLKLGYGASFNFAHIPAANKPPVGLMKPPPTIHPQAANLYVANKDETLEGSGQDGTQDPTSQTDDGSGEGEGPIAGEPKPGDPTQDPNKPKQNTEEDTVFADTSGTVTATGVPVDPALDPAYGVVVPVTIGVVEVRTFTGGNRALGVFGGNTSPIPAFIGSSPDLSGGAGFIYDPNVMYDFSPGLIIEKGTSTNANLGSYAANGSGITWGVWSGGNVTVFTDPNDDVFQEQVADPFYWMNIIPTATMPTFGTATYSLNSFDGTGTGGTLNAPTVFSTDVNFSTGQLNGTLDFTDAAANAWVTAFGGNINGTNFKANLNTTSTVNGVGAKGVMHGTFSGTDADSYGAVFDFVAIDDSKYAAGLLTATRGTQPFLSTADTTDLAAYSRTAFGVTAQGTVQLIGVSTDLGAGSANPILTNINATPATDLVARPGLAAQTSRNDYGGTGVVNGATISWGKWNGAVNPFTLYTNPADDQVTTAVNEDLYWLNLVETTTLPSTGQYNYSLYNYFGEGTAGALSSANITASVDFAAASITGAADVSDGTNNWNTTYTGTIGGTRISATLDGSSVVNGATAATGTIDGAFSGTNADTIGGLFSFTDGAALYANGSFILDNPIGTPVLNAVDNTDLAAANMRGFAVFGGTSTSAPLYGDATDLTAAGNNPIIYDTTINVIARPGATTTFTDSAFAPYTASNSEIVTWGNWNGAIEVYTDPNDVNNVTLDGNTMFWLTMNTANTVMPLTGQFYYTPLANGQEGIGTGGVISTASMDAQVDFGTGGIKGGLILQDPTYTWNTTYTGAITGAEFDATLAAGSTVNGNAAQGALHGGFTGNNADTIGGVFNLEQVGTPSIFADGTFVLNQTTPVPYLTVGDQVELNAANRIGMVVFGNNDFNTQLPLMGATTDLSSAAAGTNQLLYDSTQQVVMRSTANTTYSFEDGLTEAGGATLADGVTVATGVDIQWGDWNTEVMLHTDPADEAVKNAATMANGFSSWVSMTPTSLATMASLTGTASYTLLGGISSAATSDAAGMGLSVYSTGNPSTLFVGAFDASVDFTNSTINGVMTFDDNPANWEVTYDGLITGNTFSATTLSYNAAGATQNPNNAWEITTGGGDNAGVDGFVQGGFSGDSAEAIGGTFHFQNQTGLVNATAAGTHVIGGSFIMTQ